MRTQSLKSQLIPAWPLHSGTELNDKSGCEAELSCIAHAGVDESSSEAAAAEQAVRMAGRTTAGGKSTGKGSTEDVLNALEAAEARHNRLQQGDSPAQLQGHELLSNSTHVPSKYQLRPAPKCFLFYHEILVLPLRAVWRQECARCVCRMRIGKSF